jgi:C-terminal processing protease CtpA/Prc
MFRRPLVGPDLAFGNEVARPDHAFRQRLPIREGERYRGKVVVLIDERAISQSEHSCMFYEVAADAKFIGSPTAGANGDVTVLRVPGATMTFTGHDVRHADGRQLQRVGIQPDLEVRPTPAGIKAGRDEVLEAAVAYLRGSLAAPKAKR